MARATQDERHSLKDFRRDFGRFIARETGTEFVPAALEFDPPTQRLPEQVALSLGDLGRMPHHVAMQEAQAHCETLARRPDIDEDDDLRGALLQRLARCAAFPPADVTGALHGGDRAELHPLTQYAVVCIATAKQR